MPYSSDNNGKMNQSNPNENKKSILTAWEDIFEAEVCYIDLSEQDWRFADYFAVEDSIMHMN